MADKYYEKQSWSMAQTINKLFFKGDAQPHWLYLLYLYLMGC